MLIRNLFPYWEGSLVGFPRTQVTTIFMRVHIFLCNFVDAELLDDPKKGRHLTLLERKHAACLRKRPSFADWIHFNCFTPFNYFGGSVEYSHWIDWVDCTNDVRKMRPYSNFIPAIRRLFDAWLCFGLFYLLNQFATPRSMLEAAQTNDAQSFLQIIWLVLLASNKIYILFGLFISQEASMIACGFGYQAR